MSKCDKGYKVPARKTVEIRQLVNRFKAAFQLGPTFVPVLELYDIAANYGIFNFEVHEKANMPDEYAITYPDKKEIIIRQDVYDMALDGNGFARFTMAHELGHLVMHHSLPLARQQANQTIKPYENSEWQANKFAQELLIDTATVTRLNLSVNEITDIFGVSRNSAEVALAAIHREFNK